MATYLTEPLYSKESFFDKQQGTSFTFKTASRISWVFEFVFLELLIISWAAETESLYVICYEQYPKQKQKYLQ